MPAAKTAGFVFYDNVIFSRSFPVIKWIILNCLILLFVWETNNEIFLTSMQQSFSITTASQEALYDITNEVANLVARSNVQQGIVNVYVRGATAAIMIQENWDESVQTDVIHLLQKLIPSGVWLHDAQDGNGDAHLKAGIVGPQETIPIINGKIGLSSWQNIFLCEFDGPRQKREIVVSVLATAG